MMNQNMNLRDLIYFLKIADEKNITNAAKKLFIAQPSLSQYLKKLELTIGAPLFHRLPSGVTLTDVGEKYYKLARHILKSVEDFNFEISDIEHLHSGTIKFGISPNMGTCLLPYIIANFRKICPLLTLHIEEIPSPLQEAQLLEGKIDFSLMHLRSKDKLNDALTYNKLGKDQFMLIIPQSFTNLCKKIYQQDSTFYCDIKNIADMPIITLQANQLIRQITMQILKRAGITNPHIILETPSTATALRMAALGLGVSILPRQDIYLSSFPDNPLICNIPDSYKAYWEICYTTINNSYLSKADKLFLQSVKAAIGFYEDEIAVKEKESWNKVGKL